METQRFSPPAENKNKIEIQELDKRVHSLLVKAFVHFKRGDSDLGDFFIEKAIDKAEQKGQVIPITIIESIMDGKAPEDVYAEKQERIKRLKSDASHIRNNLTETLSPVKKNIEKLLYDIWKQLETSLHRDIEIIPAK